MPLLLHGVAQLGEAADVGGRVQAQRDVLQQLPEEPVSGADQDRGDADVVESRVCAAPWTRKEGIAEVEPA
ncbi:hypothetical protein ACIGXF_15845 [Streptomyces sp. NPDC053086]|uniref:hypothetical protein n=1 Tax=unclassified Streptomyces TaxID=2593676 RepID=UPI0037D635A2